jgi:excisionase family DNA binding protein
MFEEFGDILTVEETCEALRIGRNSLYALLYSGQLKGFRNGRVWRIPRESLVEFVHIQADLKLS